ncbi:MAG TPA: phosphoglycerate kinase [Candidatus Sulfotelmatobacter sp.]|nr:phosphoglycerate kinase [Candidatus Sulfotelmatobacter sp.]
MFSKKTVKDINLENKTVLLRADYNVPIKNGEITDDYRIRQSLLTVDYILSHAKNLVIISHLGRPKGQVNKEMSLKPIAAKLAKLTGRRVHFLDDCIGEKATQAKANLPRHEILLLENLRFHPEEESDNEDFARQLSENCQVFVEDGFAVVHRKHASTYAITKLLPSVAGLLLAKEVDNITSVMHDPKRPLAAIIGGAKISDKIELIETFMRHSDFMAVGGALANTFLAAKSIPVGRSLIDLKEIKLAREIMARSEIESKKRKFTLAIPFDVVVSQDMEGRHSTRIVDFSANNYADIVSYPHKPSEKDMRILDHEMILDIGPFSAAFIAGAIQLSSTVVWNGTMGVTETKGLRGLIGPYTHGTQTVIEAIVGDLGTRPYSLVGGGDTVGYIESRGLVDSFDHVSTGGGASLELMSGHKLPGVEALEDKR